MTELSLSSVEPYASTHTEPALPMEWLRFDQAGRQYIEALHQHIAADRVHRAYTTSQWLLKTIGMPREEAVSANDWLRSMVQQLQPLAQWAPRMLWHCWYLRWTSLEQMHSSASAFLDKWKKQGLPKDDIRLQTLMLTCARANAWAKSWWALFSQHPNHNSTLMHQQRAGRYYMEAASKLALLREQKDHPLHELAQALTLSIQQEPWFGSVNRLEA